MSRAREFKDLRAQRLSRSARKSNIKTILHVRIGVFGGPLVAHRVRNSGFQGKS